MSFDSESSVCRSLRTMLEATPEQGSFRESPDLRSVLAGLECFISPVLTEIYPEWRHECLDGLWPIVAKKVGEREAELFGLCIFISDQTTTPFHLRIQIAADVDEVSWCECRVGEKTARGMVRDKWNLNALPKRLHALEGREHDIEWVYKAAYGARNPAA